MARFSSPQPYCKNHTQPQSVLPYLAQGLEETKNCVTE